MKESVTGAVATRGVVSAGSAGRLPRRYMKLETVAAICHTELTDPANIAALGLRTSQARRARLPPVPERLSGHF